MIRVITVAREYGSGGSQIASLVAQRLGWRILDDPFVARIAEAARASPDAVKSCDENVDPWFHRLLKALWRGGFEGALSRPDSEPVDADAIVDLWRRVIEEAAAAGGCVTVGRGGQCILRNRADAFHVYVYAPLAERTRRLRRREPPGTDLAAVAMERDRRRSAYIRHYFDADWRDPRLYDLMLGRAFTLKGANLRMIKKGEYIERGSYSIASWAG
jgi:cytidylate kinase